MEFESGIVVGADKFVIFGPEGIGKSTFASRFPKPKFIDTEGSTKKLDVVRTKRPSSWTMLMDQVRYFKNNPYDCDTLIVDTGDWAELLCKSEVCSKANKSGIEEFGYGKGYTYLVEEFGRFLNLLEELIDLGINVVIVCHAQMRKFEQPDEMGAFDRWEMKLEKKVYPLVKEWADHVFFVNYKTYVVDADGQGTGKGSNKVQGGKRMMYTSHHPCWDAKTRWTLRPEVDFDYAEIGPLVYKRPAAQSGPVTTPPPAAAPPTQAPTPPPAPPKEEAKPWNDLGTPINPNIPKALRDLMIENNVTEEEIRWAVSTKANKGKGVYPYVVPIEKYDRSFIEGVLVAAWPQMFAFIEEKRREEDNIPF